MEIIPNVSSFLNYLEIDMGMTFATKFVKLPTFCFRDISCTPEILVCSRAYSVNIILFL